MPVTRDRPESSPVVFHNRTNSTEEGQVAKEEKIESGSNTVQANVRSYADPLLAVSSSTSDVRSPRSPLVEDETYSHPRTRESSKGTSVESQTDWISPIPSGDTSSWRPSSSQSTLTSEAESACIIFTRRKPVSEKRVILSSTGGESIHSRTSTVSGTSSIDAGCYASGTPSSESTGQTDKLVSPNTAESYREWSSDPLGLFSSSSYVPSSSSFDMTSDAAFTTLARISSQKQRSQLPGAAANGIDDDEPRPVKRQRRESPESLLPPSDPCYSPCSGISATPSLPIVSSPDLPLPASYITSGPHIGFSRGSSRVFGDSLSSITADAPAQVSRVPVLRPRVGRSETASLSIPQSFSANRRSGRRAQYHPLGPRHLEYDYHIAHEELRSATILAARDLQFQWPKRTSRMAKSNKGEPEVPFSPPTLADILAAKFPHVGKARRKVDEADQRLQEALTRGETWENTPVPTSILAPTYDAIEELTAATAKSSTSASSSISSGRHTLGHSVSSPSIDVMETPPRSSGSRSSSKVNRNPVVSPGSQKTMLSYKPKPIIGKRRRIILSSDFDAKTDAE